MLKFSTADALAKTPLCCMDEKLIVIKTFNSPLDANIVKGFLASNGIDSVLFDENIVYTNPVYTTAVGGVKLLVKESDYLESLNALNKTENEYNKSKIQTICPRCDSENVKSNYLYNWISLFLMIISFAFTPNNSNLRKHKCNDCGFKWKDVTNDD